MKAILTAALLAAFTAPCASQAIRHKPQGACNRVCVSKCEASAGNAGETVEQCIALWDRLNARFGRGAARFEGSNGGRYDPQTGTISDAQANGYKLH